MNDAQSTSIQAKLIDFALVELVHQHRESFQPLWTVDSWVKFLIWLTLNCGLSGEQDSLEIFAKALGKNLSTQMRNNFFQRKLESLDIHILADPADANVLVMSLTLGKELSFSKAANAIEKVGLYERVCIDRTTWRTLESVVVIPWSASKP